jgi:hypothetical protein
MLTELSLPIPTFDIKVDSIEANTTTTTVIQIIEAIAIAILKVLFFFGGGVAPPSLPDEKLGV